MAGRSTRKLMFGRADRSLAKIDDRIAEFQKVAAQSKITIEELRQRATELTKTEMRNRLSARLDLDPQVQSLVACVRQADLMLEVSYETVQQVSRIPFWRFHVANTPRSSIGTATCARIGGRPKQIA